MTRDLIAAIEAEYRRYKALGEGAIRQLAGDELVRTVGQGGSSVTTLVWHVAGNLRSRFTDFLTSDGEKPWRDRDSEFLPRRVTRAELEEKWNGGWATLLAALGSLTDDHLGRAVTIRGRELTIREALLRSLAHVASHVGQIIFLAKALRGGDWQYMSIPPGQSTAYNENPTLERPPGPGEPKP